MTTTARPLLHAMALVAATLLAGWVGLCLFSTLWIGAALLGILLGYVGLVTGLIVIPRRTNRSSSEKVFCIGFSRTGTTSLSVALHELGYSTYHMCFKLLRWPDGYREPPRVSRFWADAFDAQTDTTAAITYQELAKLYPKARFILTTRDPLQWGASMASFYSRYALTFRYAPFLHTDAILSAAYGRDWATKTPEEYAHVYEQHLDTVRAFFTERREPERLLELSIVNGEGWQKLASHLGLEKIPDWDFPHVDVFDLSWNKQPWWQMQNLFGRLLGR